MTALSPSERRKADLIKLCEGMFRDRPLILLSNRGPVEHRVTADGELRARRGSGGLITALSSLTQYVDFTWIAGAMGDGDRRAAEAAHGSSIDSPIEGHRARLRYVVSPRDVYNKYYNVFCNPLLWFLQHYMWFSPYTPDIGAKDHDAWTNGYLPVNRAFADAAVEEARGNNAAPYVMVHDYHLYIAPMYIREALPEATISHFVHIPWPSPSYWLLLPSHIRTAICRGLCHSDVLGFQSTQDARAFVDTCEAFLPEAVVDRSSMSVDLDGHTLRVRVYPISIDIEELRATASSRACLNYQSQLQELCTEKTIVRVDRLEPSKNIVRGFKAYSLLLRRYPELRGTVTFLAFLFSSRMRVEQYQLYADEVQQEVDRVNSAYGKDGWQPIHTFYENNYVRGIAGMRLYDALLVNAVNDGMNLVSKEGPVSNTRDGVVILSEAAGAFEQLGDHVLPVGPTDIEATMQAMYDALTMPAEERGEKAAALLETIEAEDITHWLRTQLEDMRDL